LALCGYTTIGDIMKNLVAAAVALTLSSDTFAAAGNLSDPILHQDLITEDAKAGSSSSGTTMVAMMALLLFATAMNN